MLAWLIPSVALWTASVPILAVAVGRAFRDGAADEPDLLYVPTEWLDDESVLP